MCYSIPKFRNGAETLLSLKSTFHQIERAGGGNRGDFMRRVAFPDFEFFEIFQGIHQRTICALGKTNKEAQKVTKIWLKFYGRMNKLREMTFPSSKPENLESAQTKAYEIAEKLWRSRNKLINWVEGYRTGDYPSSTFKDTDLVVLNEYHPVLNNLHQNVTSLEVYKILDKTYGEFLSCIDFGGDETFQNAVKADIRYLLTRAVGHELFQKIIGKGRFTIVPGEKNETRLGKDRWFIILNHLWTPEINRVSPTMLRSFLTPSYIILAHELIHVLDGLEGTLLTMSTTASSVPYYTSQAEELAILGTAENSLRKSSKNYYCENNFRTAFRLFPRESHVFGAYFEDYSLENLRVMVVMNLEYDRRIFFASISEEELIALYASVCPDCYPEEFSVIQRHMVSLSPSTSPGDTSISESPPPVDEEPPAKKTRTDDPYCTECTPGTGQD